MFRFLIPIVCIIVTGLSLAAEDERPVVDASTVKEETAANRKLPTFHIVGDSTVKSGGRDGMWGWGERIAPFFDTTKINVVNHAIGGRSARTFFNEGRWQTVAEALRPGDIVIIQFGHNDMGRIGDPANKGRADGRGTGDETVDDIKPDGTTEKVHTFGWYLAKFASDAKARKATVILCSPVPHKQRWEKGRDFEDIARWGKEVASKQGTLFLDLTMVVTEAYRKAGAELVETYFADKGTHTTDAGARLNATCVIEGLKGLPGGPVDRYLRTADPTKLRFSFGEAKPNPGWTRVAAGIPYSVETGYGFEEGTSAGGKRFLFSVTLPEGNYSVTVLADSGTPDLSMTVKSEMRRLMLEQIRTPGPHTFICNVRVPDISTGGKVRLKSRELESEMRGWDGKLTLEFNGSNPGLKALTISPVEVPTLFIAGDSTVCDQPAEPWNSWGQMLPRFFTPTVAVANYANSGESIRSSLGAGRFDKVFSLMKRGDYLFIQFGHNDQKDKSPDALETYRGNLKKLVARTRTLGGTPVLVTSMERKSGVKQDTLGGYPDAVRSVANEEGCALIDLHAMSRTLYQALGGDLGKAFQDGTHHNNYGSYELAKCVVFGIRQAKLPLAKAIVPDSGGFDPAKPDPVTTFEMPASPTVSDVKPLGN